MKSSTSMPAVLKILGLVPLLLFSQGSPASGQRWDEPVTTRVFAGIDKLLTWNRTIYGMNRDGIFYTSRYYYSVKDEDWNVVLRSGVTDAVSMTPDQQWVIGKHGQVWKLDDRKKELKQQLKVTEADLNAVAYYGGGSSSKGLIAVGMRGAIVAQEPGGESLRLLSENRFPELFDVRELDYKTVWAVGDSGCIVVSSDKGVTWQERFRRHEYRFHRIIMFDVATILLAGTDLSTNTALLIKTDIQRNTWEERRFESSTRIFDGQLSVHLKTVYIVGDNALFARSTDKGVNWEILDWGANIAFTGVCFTDRIVSAVGRSPVDGRYRYVASTDSGRTWSMRFDSGDSLGAVIASRRSYPDLCALSNGAVINHQDFGDVTSAKPAAWLPFTPICCATLRYRDYLVGGKQGRLARIRENGPPPVISTVIPDDFIAMDSNGGDTLLAIAAGGIYRSADTGTTWSGLSVLASGHRLSRCIFVNRTDCYMTGMYTGEGVLKKSTDAGASWFTLLHHPADVTGFTIDEKGAYYVCTADGKLLISSDQGASWSTLLSMEGRHFRDVASACYASEMFLLEDGETVLRSGDGGRSWAAYHFPGEDFLHITATYRQFRAWGNSMSAMRFSMETCTFPFRKQYPDIRSIASNLALTQAIAITSTGTPISLSNARPGMGAEVYVHPQAIRYREVLRDVCWPGSNIVAAIGDSGIIIRCVRGITEWEAVHRDPGIGTLTQALALPSGGALAAGDSVLLRGDSTGMQWMRLPGYPGKRLALFDDRTWIACSDDGGVHLTEDAGREWVQTGRLPGTMRDIGVCGISRIFALIEGDSSGSVRFFLTRSLDFGRSWDTLKQTGDSISRMRIFEGARIFLLGSRGRVLIGDDYGRRWTETQSPLLKTFHDVARLDFYRYLFTGEDRVFDILRLDEPRTTNTVSLPAPFSVGIETVFPNPAGSSLHIAMASAAAQNVELSLTNTLGGIVWRGRHEMQPGKSEAVHLDVSGLPSGLYFLRMSGTGGTDCRRVVVYR